MIVAEICRGTSSEKRYYMQQDLYNYLGKKYKKFYFINIHNIHNIFNIFNQKKLRIDNNFYKKRNIVHFNPKSITD